MEFERIDPNSVFINSYSPVKFTSMGNIFEIQYMSHVNFKQTVQMLPGMTHYVDLSTGEIKECCKYKTRQDSVKNLRKTFSRLRALINCNVTNSQNVRWITLTYAENMQDTKRLYMDFKSFNQRFHRYCKCNNYTKPEYIVVAEPQARGAWHLHLLYIWSCSAPFIPNDVLANIWGHGFVKITKIDDNIDNIGVYLTAYLTDVELELPAGLKIDDFNKIDERIKIINSGGQKKGYIKGGRLSMYPAKMNIYRASKGLKKPDIDYMTYSDAKKKVSSAKLTFSSAIKITGVDSNFDNIIFKEYYNNTAL